MNLIGASDWGWGGGGRVVSSSAALATDAARFITSQNINQPKYTTFWLLRFALLWVAVQCLDCVVRLAIRGPTAAHTHTHFARSP